MRVAALYDIHGNLPALEAVLREIRQVGVDRIVVGGDIFPGPMPRDTLACLHQLEWPVDYIVGNGDREVLAQRRGSETEWYRTAPEAWREPVRWTAQQLAADHAQLIASWPATCSVDIPGLGDVLFCHATPRSDTEMVTCLTAESHLLSIFAEVAANVVICGHSHMPFDRTVGKIRLVNAGSVGMPFCAPGAYWLLLGPTVEPRRTFYDLAEAAERVRRTTYPQAEQFATQSILQPPSEEKTLEALARIDVR